MKLLVILIGQEKDQRSLDLNTAKCMLGLLLGKTWPLFPVFNQFLEVGVVKFPLKHSCFKQQCIRFENLV